MLRQAAGAALGALAVSGCVAGPAPAASPDERRDGVSRAAVRPAGASYMEALASGTLRADRSTGCLWLEREDGATVQLLLQGEEYGVDISQPLPAVLHGDAVLARAGQHVVVAGGSTEHLDGVEGCPVTATTFLGHFEDTGG